MTTRMHQTWDLGDGELTIDLSHIKPLPPAAYSVLAVLADNMQAHADALRMLLDDAADADTPDGGTTDIPPGQCGEETANDETRHRGTHICRRSNPHAGIHLCAVCGHQWERAGSGG